MGGDWQEETDLWIPRAFELELLSWGLGTPLVSCTTLTLEAESKCVVVEGSGVACGHFLGRGCITFISSQRGLVPPKTENH